MWFRTSEGKKGVDLHLGDIPMSHPFLIPDELISVASVMLYSLTYSSFNHCVISH